MDNYTDSMIYDDKLILSSFVSNTQLFLALQQPYLTLHDHFKVKVVIGVRTNFVYPFWYLKVG